MWMSHTQRNSGFLFLGTTAVRLIFNLSSGFIVDNAFVTFRYARDIAAGLGFVYNPGQHVLGTGTPLFTLILSLFSVVGIGPVHGAMLVSLVASGFTSVYIYRFAEKLRFGRAAFVPAFVYMLWPRSVVADMSGTSTALLTLLVIAAFYYQFTRRQYYALGAATLATVCRPEGVFLLIILFIHNLRHHREDLGRTILIPAAITVPWTAFATWYFGSPIPETIIARLALYSHGGAGSALERLVQLLGLSQPFGWILIVCAVTGGIWLWKAQDFGRLELVWLIATVVVFTLRPVHLSFWEITPMYPVYFLFGAALLPFAFDRWDYLGAQQSNILPTVAVLVLLGLGSGLTLSIRDHRQERIRLNDTHLSIGWYLRTHAEETDLIAAEDIGYIGYYSRRNILDRDGQVSPEAVPYNRKGKYYQLIADYRPEWVVASSESPISPFVTDSTFLSNYTEEQSYPFFGSNRYIIFRRTVPKSTE